MQGLFGWASSENYDESLSQWLLKNGSQIPENKVILSQSSERKAPSSTPNGKVASACIAPSTDLGTVRGGSGTSQLTHE